MGRRQHVPEPRVGIQSVAECPGPLPTVPGWSWMDPSRNQGFPQIYIFFPNSPPQIPSAPRVSSLGLGCRC